MSRWAAFYITLLDQPIQIIWDDALIIEETAHHWFRLGYTMEDLQVVHMPYWANKPPKLVRKSDFVDGYLVINDDHPMKWFYDRVENEDE